jgi:hypothetical protein
MNRFLMAIAVLALTFTFVGDASAHQVRSRFGRIVPHRHVPSRTVHRHVPRVTPSRCTCGRVGTCRVHHRTFRPAYRSNGLQLNLGRFQLNIGGQRPSFGPFFR